MRVAFRNLALLILPCFVLIACATSSVFGDTYVYKPVVQSEVPATISSYIKIKSEDRDWLGLSERTTIVSLSKINGIHVANSDSPIPFTLNVSPGKNKLTLSIYLIDFSVGQDKSNFDFIIDMLPGEKYSLNAAFITGVGTCSFYNVWIQDSAGKKVSETSLKLEKEKRFSMTPPNCSRL